MAGVLALWLEARLYVPPTTWAQTRRASIGRHPRRDSISSLAPARRAASVDPALTLRAEQRRRRVESHAESAREGEVATDQIRRLKAQGLFG